MYVRYLRHLETKHGRRRPGHIGCVPDTVGQQLVAEGSAVQCTEYARPCRSWSGDKDRDHVLREAAEVEELRRLEAHRRIAAQRANKAGIR